MSAFLISKDLEFKQSEFSDVNIDSLFWTKNEQTDKIRNIINKYNNVLYDNFTIENDELLIVKEELQNNYHVLIEIFLQYLVASSNEKDSSSLVECCKRYIEDYFQNIGKNNRGVATHNLSIVLIWTFSRFPRYKKEISEDIYNRIMNGKEAAINFFSLAFYFMNNKTLSNIFNIKEYENIYSKYFVEETDSIHIYLYLDYYKKYLEYLCDHKQPKKEFAKKYCYFVIKNIDLIDNYVKQILLQEILDLMNELKCFTDEEYSIIHEHLDMANKAAKEAIKVHSISISKDQVADLEKIAKQQELIFKSLNNVDKILKLMVDLEPISKYAIQKVIEQGKNSITSIFQERILDSDGMIINYKELSEEQMFSLKSRCYIQCNIQLIFDALITPFFRNFIFDDNVIGFIKSIFINNQLVSSERSEVLSDSFIEFFKKNFKGSVYDIVEELEESLRYYFKNEKMNIYKMNRKRDLVGLSNMLDNSSAFASKLLEIIDDDFFYTLRWFLVDDYGYGLRNMIAHRYNSKDSYRTQYSIYISLLILKLYMGFKV